MVSLVEGVAFKTSSYNMSLPENQLTGTTVGRVWASSGSSLYDVTYTLKTNGDLFSVDAGGEIRTKASLDKEKQEWYFLEVEAVDTRTPPTSATAAVRARKRFYTKKSFGFICVLVFLWRFQTQEPQTDRCFCLSGQSSGGGCERVAPVSP